MNRDWTEAEARAWLRASLPKGHAVRALAVPWWRSPSLKRQAVAACGAHDLELFRTAGEKRPLVALDAVGEPVGLIAIINPDSYESLWPYSPPGPTP